jgi:thiazole tautomerase (transcriptional regulator TenI)
MNAIASPLICLVTDRRAATPNARTTRDEVDGLERQLDDAFAAAVDLVQVRESGLAAATLRALVERLVRRAPAASRVVVNDRADVARAGGAAGVHLRGDGPPASRVRPLGPEGWIVGRSVHSAEEAHRATDADYLLFGSVFASLSKGPGAAVAGVARLRAAVQAVPVRVLAIGGVTPEHVAECRAAGAAGVAAIGVFLPRGSAPGALGAAEAIRSLRRAWAAAEGS